MPFKIIKNDITKMDVDVIVKLTNSQIYSTFGVDEEIHLSKASWFESKMKKSRSALPENLKLEREKKLSAEYIIHIVEPILEVEKNNEEKILMDCYKNSLNLAVKKKFKSIAFPIIAGIIPDYPKDKELIIAVSTINKFLMAHEIEVYLVVCDETSFKLSSKLHKKIETFINNNYVDEKSLYVRRDKRKEILKVSNFSEEVFYKKYKIEEFEPLLEESFSEMMLRLIKDKGYTDPEIYKAANVSRQTFNKIKNKEKYKPKKETIVSLAMALKLNYDELIDLLKSAGLALAKNNYFDLIVRYYFEKEIYDLCEMNIVIYEFTGKSL